MEINLSNCVKISPNARIKMVNDFFPKVKEKIEECDYDDNHLSIHAGALCLYATTLLTKIYDKSPEQSDKEFNVIELESNKRELALQNALKTSADFAHYTEEQIKAEAHKMILRDMRNAFAHGNFKISYSPYTKKLYFVLIPRRHDFDIAEPIVISKNSLKKALGKTISDTALKYAMRSPSALMDTVKTSLNTPLQTLMLPSQLLQVAEHYLDNNRTGQKLTINEKRFLLIQYAMLITQATYEQDDYYHIFGKNSNIFKKIALVRNANAHESLFFGELAKMITYVDRNKTLEESLQKSVASLLIACTLKESILSLMATHENRDAIAHLKDKLTDAFDFLFTDGDDELPDLSDFDDDENTI
jgi:hypothetical protein